LENGQIDQGRCSIELLDLLGLAGPDEQAVLQAHALPERPTDEPYAGSIGESDRHVQWAHPGTAVVADVFAALWEGAPALSNVSLEILDVTAKDKVSAISDLDVAKIFSQAGKALSNQRAGLYVTADADFEGVRLVSVAPTALVISKRYAEAASVPELRFRIGQALEMLRPEYVLAATMDAVVLEDVFMAAVKAFHPRHNRWRAGSEDAAAEEAAKLKKALPYKLAKRIAEIFQEHADAELSCAEWRTSVLETGNRAGLLLCGQLRAAAQVILRDTTVGLPEVIDADVVREHAKRPGPFLDLLRFFVSPEHHKLRGVLGTAARG
jgi:hypothetical protein